MKEFIKKYGSRKFILALLTNVLCISTILSGYGGKIGIISSVIALVVNTAIYVINEAKVDAESVNKVIKLSVDNYNEIQELLDLYKKETNIIDVKKVGD